MKKVRIFRAWFSQFPEVEDGEMTHAVEIIEGPTVQIS